MDSTETTTAIAVMQRDLGYVRASVDEMKLSVRDALKEMRDQFSTKEELTTVRKDFETLRAQIYTIAFLIIAAVVAAWLKIVVK